MPTISLGGRDFELRSTPPKAGAMLAIAAAEKSGDELRAMSLYYRLIVNIVSEDVTTDELDAALSDMDFPEIRDALEQAAKSYTVDPTLPARNTSGRSSDGSQDTQPTSRVVSFSQAKAG